MSFVNKQTIRPRNNVNKEDIEAQPVISSVHHETVFTNKPTGFRLFGNFAAAAYEKVDERDDFLNDRLLDDYKIDEGLSDEENVVVYNDDVRRVVFIFRGTDPTSLKDLLDDAHITLGTFGYFDSRFEPSLDLVRKVITEYPGFQIIISGHSLGAYIAYQVSVKMCKESYDFALPASMWQILPQTSSFNWLLGAFGSNHLDKHIYTTILDPIGMLGYLAKGMRGDKHLVKRKATYYWNPHSVEHFT